MQENRSAPQRYLIIGPSWVGDMVLAQSLFKTLKQNQPDCVIDVAAPTWTLPLLARMPEVTQAIPLPFKHKQLDLRKRISLGRSLRQQGYHQAILLTNSLKSAILPFFANIPKRTGFLGEMRYGLLNDIRALDKAALPRTVDRFVALGLARNQTLPSNIPTPTLIAQHTQRQHLFEKFNISFSAHPVLGLCPGAEYGEAKRWPIEYYAEVANSMITKGWHVWLFGSQKDADATAQINALTQQRCIDLAGKTSLGEAIDLMAHCNKVVSNDSGLMHVAAALQKPVIALYGSSDPHHTPPMHSAAHILYLGLPCSPCFQRTCLLQSDAHMACLKHIKPAQVITPLLAE